MARRLLPLLTVSLLAAALAAAPAGARQSHKKAIWGPTSIAGVSQFPEYRRLGAGIYEISMNWSRVAPTRPRHARDPNDAAYQWPADVDAAVAEAPRHNMRVLVQVIGAPRWANGGHAWNYAPHRPADYANFVRAAARRYRTVHLWMVWGEPSRRPDFRPLTPARPGTKLTRRQAAAPRRYARILDAAYGALKRESSRNLVVGGNTYTTGDISTYQWIENLRLPNGRPPRMDLYGHNPFSFREPNLANPPSPMQQVDFSDLRRLASLIDRRLRGSSRHTIRLFLSEWTIPTHVDGEFNYYVDPPVQARWIRSGLAIVRRWSRIYSLGWIHVRDDPPTSYGGLLTEGGTRKLGYAAFRSG